MEWRLVVLCAKSRVFDCLACADRSSMDGCITCVGVLMLWYLFVSLCPHVCSCRVVSSTPSRNT